MSDTKGLIQSTLKQAGYSASRSRVLIFSFFDGHEPQTVSELIKRAAGKVDRASVYRTVELFEKLGIVHRLHIGWKYKLELTDQYSHHHHHLSCENCGKVIPIKEDNALEMMIGAVAKQASFQASSHELEIRGLCIDCQQLNS